MPINTVNDKEKIDPIIKKIAIFLNLKNEVISASNGQTGIRKINANKTLNPKLTGDSIVSISYF